MCVTVVGTDHVESPDRRDYQQYIDVRFDNGAVARHAFDGDSRYLIEIHRPPDGSARDGRVVARDTGSDELPEVVDEWVRDVAECIESGDVGRWDVEAVLGE
jgi:hypothetical protein